MSAPSPQAGAAGIQPHCEAHREAQDLLPWLANGSLAGDELARVEAHLGACAQCRADLDTLYTLRDAADAPLPDLDPEAALARLLPQLDAPAVTTSATLPAVPGWRARLAANDARWLRVAMGLQFCTIAVLTAMLVRPDDAGVPPDAYRVLGADAASGNVVVVTFRPDTPERELRRIVSASGARIVGGPTVTGAWMLGSGDAADAVAARLRSQPAVTLAEPLGTGAPQ
jgi:anti-sigma factor RsiW